MKVGWQVRPLHSLCNDFKQDIVDGPFGSELQRKDYITEGIPVLKIQNIRPFAIELKKMDYVSSSKFQELKRHSFGRGDIVMTKLGNPLGVSAIVEDLDDGVIVADLVRIRAQRINTKYLCYHLNSQRTNDFINSMQKGTTRPRVTLSVVRELPIAVPSPEEQQRIVAILDEAFDGIAKARANAEKNLQNSRALFESHLQAVFTQHGDGWTERLLSELCDIKHGYAFDGKEFSSDVPEGKPIVITPGNFTEDGKLHFNEKNTKRYSGEPPDAFRFDIGDLVVVMTDLSSKMKILGKPAFVEADDVLHNQRIGRVVFFDEVVEKRFVYYFMMSNGFLENIKASATGTMVKHTAPSRILSNVISFPREKSKQLEYVAKFDNLRQETQRLESLYQRKLAALDELKKSLLHQAFSGQL